MQKCSDTFIRTLIGTNVALPLSGQRVLGKPRCCFNILKLHSPIKTKPFSRVWIIPGLQIIQSLIAIGSGSWLGTGIAHSQQKFFYLPMQHTDFIFSIIAEETGFVGCLFLIVLFVLLLYFGIRIAHQITNTFSSLVILGFVILMSLQTAMNMAVATGLAPTKGVGMPFVSYGNSSLVCYLFMIGVMINMVYKDT